MCKFCEAIAIYGRSWAIQKKWSEERHEEDLRHEITVALVEKTWTKSRGKRRAGRSTDYRRQGLGYALNYCPECGRKREKEETRA